MQIRIRWKLILSIGLPLWGLSMAVLSVDYQLLRKAAYEHTESDLAELAEQHAAHIDANFQSAAQIARTTANILTVDDSLTEPQLFNLLKINLKHNPHVYGSCIAYEPGVFAPRRQRFAPYVCRQGDGFKAIDLSQAYDYADGNWQWYREPHADETAWWTDPYFDEGAGDIAMVTLSAPFFRSDRFAGVATVDIQLDTLQTQLAMKEIEHGEWMIVNGEGAFVSAPTPELILSETLYTIAERAGRTAELNPLADRITSGERGTGRIVSMRTGEPLLIVFTPIPSTGWAFVVGVPESVIMGPVYARLQQRTAILTGAIALMLLLVFIVSYWITRPVEKLSSAVQRLGEGDLTANVPDIRSRDELGQLARAFNHMVEQLKQHIDALTQATRAREAVESELRVAREIQTSLLPTTFPPFPHRPEFDLHATNAAARSVAGDFFDFFFVNENRLALVIADVSGKGIPAALLMAVTRTLIRNLAASIECPGRILTEANRLLAEDNRRSMFVTLFLGFYDVRTGAITYANAGHPLPFKISTDRAVTEVGEPTGLVLAVMDNETYSEATMQLDAGESIVLFTDGVHEAATPGGELYGLERLQQHLQRHADLDPERLCQATVEELNVYQKDRSQDDITLLVLRRNQ